MGMATRIVPAADAAFPGFGSGCPFRGAVPGVVMGIVRLQAA